MNILRFQDVEKYLQNKQVYFKKEICNPDFKTIAQSHRVHNVGKVEAKRLNERQIAFSITIDTNETIMYEYMTNLEFYAWIRCNFIPINELIKHWQL